MSSVVEKKMSVLTVTANNPSHFDFGFEHVQIITHVEITICKIIFMSNYPDSISTLSSLSQFYSYEIGIRSG